MFILTYNKFKKKLIGGVVMKKYFLIASIQVFAFLGFGFESYFSPNDNLDVVVVKEIQQANQSIDMSIYTFMSEPIREAIIEKLKANPQFKFRAIVRKANKENTTKFLQPIYDQLLANKIKEEVIRYVTTTNHHKYIIVDEKTLVNSSGNFNDSKLALSYDENLFVCSAKCKDLLVSFQEEFDFLYSNSNSMMVDEEIKTVNKTKRPKFESAIFTSHNFEPVIRKPKVSFSLTAQAKASSMGEVETELLKVISEAKKSIWVATGHFRSWTLASALIEAAKKGIDVEVILDSQEYISAGYQDIENKERDDCLLTGKTLDDCYQAGFHFGRLLSENGVQVLFKYYMTSWNFIFAPQMHHKYMIVDGKTLYAGSYNWSKNAEFKTIENIAIIKDKKALKAYEDNYNYLKSYGQGELDPLMDSWKKEQNELTLLFKPMTLNVAEIDQLRAVACEKCPSTFCPASSQERVKVTSKNTCLVEKK